MMEAENKKYALIEEELRHVGSDMQLPSHETGSSEANGETSSASPESDQYITESS